MKNYLPLPPAVHCGGGPDFTQHFSAEQMREYVDLHLAAQHALIVQMQAALESCDAGAAEDGGRQWYDDKLVDAALEAAEAYLRDPETRLRQEIQRFALTGDPGAECVRNGHGYWELHRDGKLVRGLNRFERNYIDSAIRACQGLSSSA